MIVYFIYIIIALIILFVMYIWFKAVNRGIQAKSKNKSADKETEKNKKK